MRPHPRQGYLQTAESLPPCGCTIPVRDTSSPANGLLMPFSAWRAIAISLHARGNILIKPYIDNAG